MKNRYQFFLVVLYFLIYTQPTLGQNHSFTDKYDLNFEYQKKKNSCWLVDPNLPMYLRIDSSQTLNGKKPLCFTQIKNAKFALKLEGTMQQRILLPKTNADSITISLNCKSKNLQFAKMIISGITDLEVVLYSDTLSLLGSDEWKTYSRSVSGHNVAFLNLNIQVEGINSDSEQRLYLGKIKMKLERKDINDFPLPTISIIPDIKKNDIISLSPSDKDSYKKIHELEDKKIVAIGETTHGSETINETAVQLIKYRVENNHCKLILLELPTETTLGWNRFIQGDSLFKIKNFNKDLQISLLSPRVMIDLLNWLKQYNANVKDKVWLLGMDLNFKTIQTSGYYFEYIDNINKNIKNIQLDSLCLKLYNPRSYPQALQFLEHHKELEVLLGKTEYEIFHHCLKMAINAGDNNDRRLFNRDNQMYLNTTFLLNLLCPGNENATIYTHIGHANYKTLNSSSLIRRSFGSYMKYKFGNDYYTIAVLTGEGNFITGDKDSLFVKRMLENSPGNSLENMFMRTHEELCFIPVSILPSQLTYTRDTGSQYQENQFSIIAPASRMDAIIFVRKSKEFKILPGTPTSSKAPLTNFLFKQLLEQAQRYQLIQNRMK